MLNLDQECVDDKSGVKASHRRAEFAGRGTERLTGISTQEFVDR
jgi:hypothetical protein